MEKKVAATKKNPKQSTHLGFGSLLPQNQASSLGGGCRGMGCRPARPVGWHLATRRSYSNAANCPHDPWRPLRYRIAFALRRASKIVRGLKASLTEAERYALADHVVAHLKERGDPWGLSKEAKAKPSPTT